MAWKFRFSKRAEKDLEKLDLTVAKRILKELKEISLLDDPRQRGKALTGNHKGLWRYRVGNFRVVCAFKNNELVIIALAIGHRSEVYKSRLTPSHEVVAELPADLDRVRRLSAIANIPFDSVSDLGLPVESRTDFEACFDKGQGLER